MRSPDVHLTAVRINPGVLAVPEELPRVLIGRQQGDVHESIVIERVQAEQRPLRELVVHVVIARPYHIGRTKEGAETTVRRVQGDPLPALEDRAQTRRAALHTTRSPTAHRR